MGFQRVTFNLRAAGVREAELNGKTHLVVPMVMMTEGVHSGSRGPYYYPASELEKASLAWNHKPILIDHPALQDSGCKPEVLNKQSVGVVLNTKWDGKQRSEAWLDKERLGAIAPEIATNIANNVITEVSTGLYFDEADGPGMWNDEPYLAVAKDHKPDHLAILPNDVGACSVTKGAGLLQLNKAQQQKPEEALKELYRLRETTNQEITKLTNNELSHSDIRSNLYSKLTDYFNGMFDGWIEDIYETFVIFWTESGLQKLGYKVSDDQVELEGSPEQVVRVTEYRTVSGALVGNSAGTSNPLEKSVMDKKQKVDGLIANKATHWTEEDREILMAMEEKVLDKLSPIENKETEKKDPPKGEEKKEESKILNENKEAPKMDPAIWLNSAPPEIQDMLKEGLAVRNQQRAQLIKTITENKSNKFKAEYLQQQPIEVLQGIAALAQNSSGSDILNSNEAPLYMGAGVADPTFNSHRGPIAEEDSLPPPTLNFDEEAAELKKAV